MSREASAEQTMRKLMLSTIHMMRIVDHRSAQDIDEWMVEWAIACYRQGRADCEKEHDAAAS